jgi:hypothetical protein
LFENGRGFFFCYVELNKLGQPHPWLGMDTLADTIEIRIDILPYDRLGFSGIFCLIKNKLERVLKKNQSLWR